MPVELLSNPVTLLIAIGALLMLYGLAGSGTAPMRLPWGIELPPLGPRRGQATSAIGGLVLVGAIAWMLMRPPPTPPTPPPGLTPQSTEAKPGECAFEVHQQFRAVVRGSLVDDLGCPINAGWDGEPGSEQPFEGGHMIWWGHTKMIAVLGFGQSTVNTGPWDEISDTFDARFEPPSPPYAPPTATPPDQFAPINGFGKLWRSTTNHADIRPYLKFATARETQFANALVQEFKEGKVARTPSGIWVLKSNGFWQRY